MRATSAAAAAVAAALSVLLLLSFAASGSGNQDVVGDGWEYFCFDNNTGGCSNTDPVSTQGGYVPMGGGTDVDSAFHWMVERSGHGRFLVLRCNDRDNLYNSYVYGLDRVISASTLVVNTTKAADDPALIDIVKKASAIFFAGGDQSMYVERWNGTALLAVVRSLVGVVPMGGTSAGMAVLPQYVNTAESPNGAMSDVVLRNPYDRTVTLGTGYLDVPLFHNTITDMHFYQRNRFGRLLVFLARLLKDFMPANEPVIRGIACDEQSALLVDPASAVATLANTPTADPGACYFVLATRSPQTVCEPLIPLSMPATLVYRISRRDPSQSFDLRAWRPLGPDGTTTYNITVDAGKLLSTQPNGEIY
eukprot:m.59385 g.59385  ORF g.59385 m.59385 type:complete len:363 (-) comp13574_c0_seq1:370-1458(-)